MNKISIGILGIGAIGSVISHVLQQNRELELCYFNRSPRERLKIKNGDAFFEIPIKCENNSTQKYALDWLIICLKEHHFARANSWFEQLIGSQTKVAIIRNGLQHQEPILKYTAGENIVECIIDCPTQPIENGFYEQLRKPVLTISKWRLSIEFAKLFSKETATVKITDDFKTEGWKKVCESSALGAILCLTGETCWVFQDEKMQDLYRSILNEAIAVAKVDGARIEDDFTEKMLQKLMKYPANKGSSMLTDRLNGRPIELGAKNRVITKIGANYELKTPLNDLICLLLSKVNHSTN